MELMESTSVVWVVTDAHADVVMMVSGSDAPEVVAEWADRGYTVASLDASEVRAA